MEESWVVGKKYHDFVVTNVVDIDELQCRLIELIHEPTGAQIMQIANEDDENLFNLSFRTWPENSNGVAHILEHTVLCGSKKFPLRDPFFSMTRRSLNTFMNALTGADFTCYPAASQVPKDFYNLLEVYIDSVFNPRLMKKSFLQEGHRLEFSTPDNPSSDLLFKGVVFNEMKGALATGEARLGEAIMKGLFPDLTYGVNSGGDPKEIPNLTFENLKTFHEKFYHPSRCLFYFYGNLPLTSHLDFLEKNAFQGVKKASWLTSLPKQSRFKSPVYKDCTYPIAEEEEHTNKTLLAMGWLTCSILDQEELLALNILDIVLMGTDASPLKCALLKSKLCKQSDSIIDNDISEIPYIIVCKGCAEETANDIETVIRNTLDKIVKDGISKRIIEASIHQLELARSEITGNSSPYGLSLFFRSALLKQHGGNPEDGLKIHTLFNKLRKKVESSNYLPNLIQKHFLDNSHFVQITMKPDKTLAKKEIDEEKKTLQEIKTSISKDDGLKLAAQSKELVSYQEENESRNLDALPKVTLKDVSKSGKEFLLKRDKVGSFETFHHNCFTNEIVYADIIFDLPNIEEADLSLFRLFTLLLPQMGCGGRNYLDNLDYILENTGGVGLSLDLYLQADDPTIMKPALCLRGKALSRKLNKLFPLFKDMVISADFTDTSRINDLLMQHFNGLESSINYNPLRYAINLAASGISTSGKIFNSWYGLEYYWAIKELVKAFEKNPNHLVEKMQSFQKQCLCTKNPHIVLSCTDKSYDELIKEDFYGLQDIPNNSFDAWQSNYPIIATPSQGRITSSPVAFTTMLWKSISYLHPLAAPLGVASEIMENKILHKRIREQGGAYGSGAVVGLLSGQFYLYSYRDPHLASTLDAFKEAVLEIISENFDASDIVEAKLGIFQDIDSPTPPGGRAITSYSRWRTKRSNDARQAFRDKLFTVDKQEIQLAAKEHLLEGINSASVVSFAGKDLLEKENALLKDRALQLFPI